MTKKTQFFIILILFITFFSFVISIIKFLQEKELTFTKKVVDFSYVSQKGIAKLKLKGTIHNDDFEVDGINANQVVDWLKAIKNSKNILGVIIELDSPGGEVGATKKIYNALKDLKQEKPIVIYINDIAASGGYYIASIANKVFAQESAIIGSIGVIMIRPNIEKFLDKIGVSINVIKAGKYKDFSYPFRELTQEEQEMYNEVINTAYKTFISDVAFGRKQSEQVILEQWAEGRIFSGKKAKSLQLIDEIGGEEEAINAIKSILKIEEINIYEPEEEQFFRLFKFLNYFFDKRFHLSENPSQLYYLFLNSYSIYKYFVQVQ